jgi:hypothetical protein
MPAAHVRDAPIPFERAAGALRRQIDSLFR